MRFGSALFFLVIILPFFSAAVPRHDLRASYLQKRQGSTPEDKTFSPLPGGSWGTEKSDSKKEGGETGSPDPKFAKPRTAGDATGFPDTLFHSPAFGSDATRNGPVGFPLTRPDGTTDNNSKGDQSQTTGGADAMKKKSSSSLQLLQQILNHTLSTLPGLEKLSDEVEKMMAGQLEDAIEKAQDTPDSPGSRTDVQGGLQGSVNATSNKTVSITAPVEMNGTDSQGRACETYGYVTLSATTLTTLSALFQSLVKLEKTVSQDGSQQSVTILQKARAQVSFTMFSVIKLTAQPAVTNCHVPPSQTTFSTQIQANVSMCAEMLTKVERDLKSGKTTASKSTNIGMDASVGANATMNSTIGELGSGDSGRGGSGGAATDPGASGDNTSLLSDKTTSPGGSGSSANSTTDPSKDPTAVSPDGTSPYVDTSLRGGDLGGSSPNGDGSLKPQDESSGSGAGSSKSSQVDQFAEVKASFAAAVQVTTGLVTSRPSQGKQGIHIGTTMDAQVNVNIKSRVSIRSSTIDDFLDSVNGGSGGQEHNSLQNPDIQHQDGMGILQNFGGSIFGTFGGNTSGSMGGGSSGSGGSSTSPDSTDPSSGAGGSYKPGSSSSGGSTDSPDSTRSSSYPDSSGKTGDRGSGGGSTDSPGITSPSSNAGGSYKPGSGSSGGSTDSPDSTGSSSYPDSSGKTGGLDSGGGRTASPGSTGSSSYPDGSGSSGNPGGLDSGSGGGTAAGRSGIQCTCTTDSSTHLRIRSLEAQLDRVHRVMHKRGLTEL